jgi:adenylyl- and sulfurtransferase ThiI
MAKKQPAAQLEDQLTDLRRRIGIAQQARAQAAHQHQVALAAEQAAAQALKTEFGADSIVAAQELEGQLRAQLEAEVSQVSALLAAASRQEG